MIPRHQIPILVALYMVPVFGIAALSGCATPRLADNAPKSEIPQLRSDPPKQWPARLTWGVVLYCGRSLHGSLDQCGCFADELQKLSPDPAAAAEPEELAAARETCGLRPEVVTQEPAVAPLNAEML